MNKSNEWKVYIDILYIFIVKYIWQMEEGFLQTLLQEVLEWKIIL